MSVPFLKSNKDGMLIRLHRALYPASSVDALKGIWSKARVSCRGEYWFLTWAGLDEPQALDVLEQALVLSKSRKAKNISGV